MSDEGASVEKCIAKRTPFPQLAKNCLSSNVGGVNHFLSVQTRALERARHFALVEGSAIPTTG